MTILFYSGYRLLYRSLSVMLHYYFVAVVAAVLLLLVVVVLFEVAVELGTLIVLSGTMRVVGP